MMSTELTITVRPLPVADEQSAPFWNAASTHVLALARCSRCASFSHPPDLVCPNCHSTDPGFVFTPVSGFDVPFVLVDVELVEQADLRLIGRLFDGPDAPLGIGDAVTLAFEDVAAGISVPAFTLEGPR
jgi:hypothetical protein